MRTHKARHFKSLLERAKDQSLLSEDFMQSAVDIVGRLLEKEMVVVYAYDSRFDNLVLVATRGLLRSAIGYVTFEVGRGISGRAAAELTPQVVPDVFLDPSFKPISTFDQDNCRSMLSAPAILEGELVGLLNVQTRDVHEYHEREVQEAAEMAQVLAPYLDELWKLDLAARLRGPVSLARMDALLPTQTYAAEIAATLATELQMTFPPRQSTVALRREDGTLTTYGDLPDATTFDALQRLANTPAEGCLAPLEDTSSISIPLRWDGEALGAIHLAGGDDSASRLSSAAGQLLLTFAATASKAIARSVRSQPPRDREDNIHDGVYRELLQLVLDDAGLDELLTHASLVTAGQLCVTDTAGAIVAGGYPEIVAADIPLQAADTTLGRLLASRSPETTPALNAVAQAIAVELSRWTTRFDVLAQSRVESLDSLFRAVDDPRAAANIARHLGLDLSKRYVPVWFRFDMEALKARSGSIVLRSLSSVLHGSLPPAPANSGFPQAEGTLLLVEQRFEDTSDISDKVADLLGRVRELAGEAPVSAGVGPVIKKLPHYEACIRQARLAADLGLELRAALPVDVSRMGIYRLLLVTDRIELSEFADDYLGRLIEHDAERGTAFVKTLEALHASGDHLGAAAEMLFVHVNTLKHRLERISELTGRDMKDAPQRFNFYVALYVYRLLTPERESLLPGLSGAVSET